MLSLRRRSHIIRHIIFTSSWSSYVSTKNSFFGRVFFSSFRIRWFHIYVWYIRYTLQSVNWIDERVATCDGALICVWHVYNNMHTQTFRDNERNEKRKWKEEKHKKTACCCQLFFPAMETFPILLGRWMPSLRAHRYSFVHSQFYRVLLLPLVFT